MTLRRLHGLIHETDVAKVPKFMVLVAQQKYMAVRPDNVAQHVYFRNAACFSLAIMMANAYELVCVYGCGACLAFIDGYLGPDAPADDDEFGGEVEEEDGEVEGGARGRARGGGRGRGRGRGGGRTGKGGGGKGGGGGKKGGKGKGQMVKQERAALFASPEFEHMMGLVQRCASGASHPKLAATVKLLKEHFEKHGEQSRVMVFTTYRSAVSELLRWLEKEGGPVRARQFIGQAGSKGATSSGDDGKGMAQKEQREVVRKFRSGEFNVLVATSIGEEGLDIGGSRVNRPPQVQIPNWHMASTAIDGLDPARSHHRILCRHHVPLNLDFISL